MIKDYFKELFLQNFGHTPTNQQLEVVNMLTDFIMEPHQQEIFILRGFAGTGKTSLISALVRTMQHIERECVLIAPTGRAAKVLSAYSCHPAFTIHKRIYRQKSIDKDSLFELNFNSGSKTLTFKDAAVPVTVQSGEDTYVYTSTLIQKDKGVTLGVNHNTIFNGMEESLQAIVSIDASAVTGGLSILGNGNHNYIIANSGEGTSLFGGDGEDTLKAGNGGNYLDGGAGDDLLIGGNGADTYVYDGQGADSIESYSKNADVINLGGSAVAVTDVDKVSYISAEKKNLVLGFSEGNSLTFVDTKEVIIGVGNDSYTYDENSIKFDDGNTQSISLGAGYTSNLSGDYATIDGSKVKTAIRITGNDDANLIYGGISGGTLIGNGGNDTLIAGSVGTYLEGSADNDWLIGGSGADTFVFNGGNDTIGGLSKFTNGGYSANDVVNVTSNLKLTAATVGLSGTDLTITFEDGDKLTFAGASAETISFVNGNVNYTLTKEYLKNDTAITLTSYFGGESFSTTGDFASIMAIDASAVTGGLSIFGNDKANTIIGGASGGLIDAGGGNDKVTLSDDTKAQFTYKYTSGKDTVNNFDGNDSLSITDSLIFGIASAKGTKNNDQFTLKFNTNNVLTLKGEDLNKVSLGEDNYLTADGLVSVGGDSSVNFNLFAGAAGRIDLTDDLYKGASITAVDASKVKNQSVTVVGSSLVTSFAFASNNKKDSFEFGGGSVTISGYGAGKDKINLGDASISSFQVGNDGKVTLQTSNNGTLVFADSLAGSEMLIHHGDLRSNAFAKMTFHDTNILYNKADKSRPTSVTIMGGASDYEADKTIKKIFAVEGISGISITAGDSNNTTLDARESGGVTLVGGKKNDRFYGSDTAADVFVYDKGDGTAGKDVIYNYGTGDKISLGGFSIADITKVNASKSSVKLTFSSKNTLTVKGDIDTLNINDADYSFSKNAVISGTGDDAKASLTSEAGGNFKLSKLDVNYVDASNVTKKNLTLTGTTAAESLVSGGKKATLKGGGGDDSLVGGSGKDTFFYAKGDTGDVKIANFDTANDNLKIANGTIIGIESVSGGVKFSMNNGRANETSEIASFTLEGINAGNVLIKANNNYYWFADGTETLASSADDEILRPDKGQLVTSGGRPDIASYADGIINLNYTTNLTRLNSNGDSVALKVKK